MSKKWQLTDRTRTLLTLELAIILPAAALMAFSIWNLKHIQRDQAIEAAIQRDFTYVLKIAEKKSWEKANELLEPVRKEYPNPEDGAQIKAKLDRILFEHPEFAYAVLYDKKTNMLVSRMQSSGDHDLDFCARAQDEIDSVQSWMPLEAPIMAEQLRMMDESGRTRQQGSMAIGWVKGDRHVYVNEAYFIPPGVAKDQVSLGVVGFDQDYLQKSFFPGVIKDVLNSKSNGLKTDANPPAMMVHPPKDSTPWVASANWVDGNPEVERTFADIFQGMVWAIKYPGTTIADIEQGSAVQLLHSRCALGAHARWNLSDVSEYFPGNEPRAAEIRFRRQRIARIAHAPRTNSPVCGNAGAWAGLTPRKSNRTISGSFGKRASG